MATKKAASAAKSAPAKKASGSTRAPAKKAAAKAPAKQVAKVVRKSPEAKVVRKAPEATPAAPGAKDPAGAPAKASKATKGQFDAKFLDAQRESLLEHLTTYHRQAEAYQAEADSLTQDREPGDVQFDEESGEGDTLAVERERDLALSAQAKAAIEEIEAALRRIDDGTYGICRISGLAIPKERLKAIPWATERVEYKVGGFGPR